jgi:hypothetical protein
MAPTYSFMEHCGADAKLVPVHDEGMMRYVDWKTPRGFYHPFLEDEHGPLFYIKRRKGVKTPRFLKELLQVAEMVKAGGMDRCDHLYMSMLVGNAYVPERHVLYRTSV